MSQRNAARPLNVTRLQLKRDHVMMSCPVISKAETLPLPCRISHDMYHLCDNAVRYTLC